MIWALLGLIGLIIILTWKPRDYMTNADVQHKLDFHASKPTSWNLTKKKDSLNKEILGPRIPKEEEKEIEAKKHKDLVDKSSVYPEIYGPEQLEIPGKKTQFSSFPTHSSEADSSEPLPYLSDFSKFKK
jgi:hypothetical protein